MSFPLREIEGPVNTHSVQIQVSILAFNTPSLTKLNEAMRERSRVDEISHLRGTTSRRSIHWSEPTLFWTVQLYVPEYSELAFFTDITGEVISMEEVGGGEQIYFTGCKM